MLLRCSDVTLSRKLCAGAASNLREQSQVGTGNLAKASSFHLEYSVVVVMRKKPKNRMPELSKQNNMALFDAANHHNLEAYIDGKVKHLYLSCSTENCWTS